MAKFRADKYWIDPEGKIAEVTDRHILEIMRHPEAFGLSSAYVKKIHIKHREPIGSEGNAREEILVRLMDRGWIRLRYISQDDSWIVQVSEKSAIPYKSRIKSWAKLHMKLGGSHYSNVKIVNLVPNLIEREFSVSEIAAGALEERRKRGQFAEFLNPGTRKYRQYGMVSRKPRKRRVRK